MPDGRKAGITKAKPKGQSLFCLAVYWTADDIAIDKSRRQQANEREAKAAVEAKAEDERRRELERLTEFPSAHYSFRKEAAEVLWKSIQVFHRIYFLDSRGSGFNFTAATDKAFQEIAKRLHLVISNGATVVDERRIAQPLVEAQARAARLDAPLQNLLKRAFEASSTDGAA
jgi:hypothetical protein